MEPSEETARLLAEGIAKLGVSRLPWSKAQLQLRHRVGFLRGARRAGGVRPSGSDTIARRSEEHWPDITDTALAETAAEWLAPFLTGKTRLADIGADDLGAALDALLPWHLKRRLDEEVPTHFEAPTGNRHAIDYEGAGAPALHIRVQELFGLTQHPAIANGRLPLTLNLLSPAHRPIQITRDLPGFLEGIMGRREGQHEGPLPAPPLARRPRLGNGDGAGQAARDVIERGNRQ